MNQMKRIIAFSLAALLVFTSFSNIPVAAGVQETTTEKPSSINQIFTQTDTQDKTVWGSFRGNNQNNGITDGKTPITSAVEKWTLKLKDPMEWEKNVSDPLLVRDEVFIVVADNLLKLNQSGQEIGRVQLAGTIDFISRMVYGAGVIYIPLSNGQIQAIDSTSMVSLWKTEGIDDVQSINTMIYSEGYLYTAVTKIDQNYAPYDGKLICVNTTDENTDSQNEIKEYEWIIDNTESGYYWGGPVIVNNYLIIGDDAGNVCSYQLDGTKVDQKKSAVSIRATMVSYGDEIYFSDCAGNLNKIAVDEAGILSDIATVNFGAYSTSTPAIYNGRAYVGGNDSSYQGLLAVIDIEKMEVIYTVSAPGSVQSSPLVTTAYDDVYVYYSANTEPGGVYCLKDSAGSNTGTAHALYMPSGDKANYCMASIITDKNGNLYYVNDSGYLFCLKEAQLVVEKVRVTGVKLNKTKAKLKIGKTLKLAAVVSPANATDKGVTWSSSNKKAATVTNTGVVKAVKPGKSVITVTTRDGKKLAKCVVSVPYSAAKSLKVSMNGLAANQKTSKIYIVKGKKVTIKGLVSPTTARQKVTYVSKKPRVASVTKKGVIKGKKIGKAVIHVRSYQSKKVKKITVYVVKKSKAVTQLKAVKTKMTIKKNKTQKIKMTVKPVNTANRLTYKTSNGKVAVVSKNGVVTGKKKGKATITVKCGKKVRKVKITVK